MTIEKALEAIQYFGFSPDSAELIIKENGFSLRGVWFQDNIIPYIEKEAVSINISMGQDECKIIAIYE